MKYIVFSILLLLSVLPLVAQEDCFGPDRGAASTDWDTHNDWAQRQDTSILKNELDSKLRSLFTCRSISDDRVRDIYADMSLVVARDVGDASCFKGDSGVVSLDRARHRKWANSKNRNSMLEAMESKSMAGIDCLDHRRQPIFYSDLSVVMAGGSVREGQQQFSDPAVAPPIQSSNELESCFGEDRRAASRDWHDHHEWAEHHDASNIKNGLDYKLRALFTCRVPGSDRLNDIYADLSVVIAQYVPNAGCFHGDSGTVSRDRNRHRKWASGKSRSAVLEAIEWKTQAAVDCVDPSRQPDFYADLSVIIAGGRIEGERWDRDHDHDR